MKHVAHPAKEEWLELKWGQDISGGALSEAEDSREEEK